MAKIRSPELKNLKAKPSDYRPGRYEEQLTIDNLIAPVSDQGEVSSLIDEFYIQANSLNAHIPYMRELAARSRCMFNLEMCNCLEQLESMIRSLAVVVEEIRR